MRPKEVKMNGQTMADAASYVHQANNPTQRGGYPGGESPTDTHTFVFDSARKPTALGFELATNRDGSRTTFEGEVKSQNAAGLLTKLTSFEDGFIEEFDLIATADPNRPAYQRWVVRSPSATVHADGVTLKNLQDWAKK